MVASSAHDGPTSRRAIALALALGMVFLCFGCNRAETLTAADSLDDAVCPFSVYWPPLDPQDNSPELAKPLLHGNLALDAKLAARGGVEVRLLITVTRPSEETNRQ
ncbi:MAG: hypothetical protein ACYC6N_29455, partial [Pirellulaceae bacterium]